MASSPSDVEIVAPPPPLVLREEEPLPSSLDKHHHNLMISPGREGSKIDEPVTTTSMSSSSSMSLDDNMLQVTSFPGREGGEDNISVDLTQVRTHPGDNLVDSSTRRKRNFHRRKSDPVTLKKIPKIEPQSDPESRHGTQISDFNSNKIGRADGFVPFLMDDEEDDDDDEIVKDDDFTRRRRLLSMSTTTSGRTRSRKSSTCRQKLQKISPPPPVKERDPEMYHFHWKNHLPHILSSFESLLGQETFCDVTLICDDNDHDDLIVPLKAHRIVLSACSEYFGRMLAEHPCKHPVIVLKDYAAWEVRALLEFMYRGEVVIGLDRVDALMKSAKSLEIRGLTEALLENAFRTNLPKHPNKQVNSNNTPAELSNHKLLLVPDSLPSTALNLSHHPHHTLSRRHNLRHNHLVEEEGDLLRHHNNFTSGPELESSFGESSPPTSDDATPLLDLIDLNNSKNQAHFHHNSLIMPRRKQARPRRRSGDFIAQDLRKVVPNEVVGGKLMRNEINNDEKLYDEEEDDDSLCGGRGSFDEDSFEENFSSGRGQNRLLSEKFGSTGGEMSFSGERDVDDEEEMEELLPPRGKSSSPSPRHDGDDDEKDEDRLEEEDNMGDDDQGIIDYTMPPIAIVGGGGNGNKATRGGMNEHVEPGVTSGWNDSLQHRHLAFLRNYNLAMAQSGKLAKLSEPDMDEQHHPHHHHHIHNHPHRRGSSSSPSPTKPPHPFLPRPDQLLSSFPFLLPGLLPPQPPQQCPPPSNPAASSPIPPSGDGRSSTGSIKHNNRTNNSPSTPPTSLPLPPPPPGNSFLSSTGAMSITPLSGGGSEGRRSGDDNTPTTNLSPAQFSPLGLTNHHPPHPHPHHHFGMDEPGRPSSQGGRNGRKYGSGSSNKEDRGGHHHPHWPGLPLGPPPIFGRHRAQHSAPRGGPPRAWSNSDLTEALHNVWNKKMTTSQASRIFGIPYNSLLMYVRGKYGKSLKLDVLKKGLDQAMENSNNIAAAAAAAAANLGFSGNGNPTTTTSSSSSSHKNSNNNNSSRSKTSPSPQPGNHNQQQQQPLISSSVTALLQSLHHNNTNKLAEANNNNNSENAQKMGSKHHRSSIHNQNGQAEQQGHLPPHPSPDHGVIPTGFNPFFFRDFESNPFLHHILPPHVLGHPN